MRKFMAILMIVMSVGALFLAVDVESRDGPGDGPEGDDEATTPDEDGCSGCGTYDGSGGDDPDEAPDFDQDDDQGQGDEGDDN